jgi:hypothetical protein
MRIMHSDYEMLLSSESIYSSHMYEKAKLFVSSVALDDLKNKLCQFVSKLSRIYISGVDRNDFAQKKEKKVKFSPILPHPP